MRELKDPVASRKLKLYKRLREAGLIPNNVIDFQIDVPLDGAVTITCKYYPDEAIDGTAISDAMVEALKAPQATEVGLQHDT